MVTYYFYKQQVMLELLFIPLVQLKLHWKNSFMIALWSENYLALIVRGSLKKIESLVHCNSLWVNPMERSTNLILCTCWVLQWKPINLNFQDKSKLTFVLSLSLKHWKYVELWKQQNHLISIFPVIFVLLQNILEMWRDWIRTFIQDIFIQIQLC